MSRRRHARIFVSLLAAAIALAGCGEKKLNTEKLEDRLREGIQQQQPGLKVKSVKCPDDVKVEKGHTFNCRATSRNGQTARVRVTQQDDDANVTYEVGG